MSLLELVGFVVVIYALWAKGDVTVNGKAGLFSFFFQAKDRKSKKRIDRRAANRPRTLPARSDASP